MKGIILNNLNSLIKRNDFNASSLDKELKSFVNLIDELQDCCLGDTLKYLLTNVTSQRDNVKKISSVVAAYSDVLNDVNLAYCKQDLKVREIVNHIDL